jgi:hypothetical protein
LDDARARPLLPRARQQQAAVGRLPSLTSARCPAPPAHPPARPQTWCRGRKRWQAESLCLDCQSFSFREYSDPDFMTPEEHQKAYWAQMTAQQQPPQPQQQRAAA